MKIEIRDLMSPKDEIGTRYFQVLPTISIVYRLGKYNVYLAYLNLGIYITVGTDQFSLQETFQTSILLYL